MQTQQETKLTPAKLKPNHLGLAALVLSRFIITITFKILLLQ